MYASRREEWVKELSSLFLAPFLSPASEAGGFAAKIAARKFPKQVSLLAG